MSYPRPILQIHQLEPTTRCNLRCRYCPQFPELPRPKQDMEWDTFLATMDLVAHYVSKGTQGELAFTGIGEPTLHPLLPEMMAKAREVLGRRPLVISTNGLEFTEALAQKIAPFSPLVFVSGHRPEKAGLAVQAAKKHGLYAGYNDSFATSAFNWAAKVNWFVSHKPQPCEYLRSGWGVVLVDGRVTTCCLDAEGSGVVGDVWTDPAQLSLKPFGLCQTCSFAVPSMEQAA